MVDLGINLRLQGAIRVVNDLKNIALKAAGLGNIGSQKSLDSRQKELDLAKSTLTVQEKINAARASIKSPVVAQNVKNIPLGSEVGGIFNKQVATNIARIREESTRAGGKINLVAIGLKAQAQAASAASSAFKNYLSTTAKTGTLEEQLAKQKNLSAAINSTIGTLKRLQAQNRKLSKNTKGLTVAQQRQLEGLERLQRITNRTRDATAGMVAQQRKLTTATAGGGAAIGDLNKSISVAIGKLLRYRVAFFLIRGVIKSVKNAIQEFIDVQDGLAQLNKVLTPIISSVTELRDVGFDFAKAYGRSVNEVIDAFKRWAQTGLEQQDVIEATKATLKAANATNLEAKDVIEALTAAIFAYKIEAAEATDVVDKWIAVQANFPVTAKDLLRGLETIGVAAKDFGLSIDELNGQITAIAATTRKSGKAVAQSLKTIFARIPRDQTIKAFQEVGVAVVAEGNKFREFDDIIEDLSAEWSGLTDAQRKHIAQVAGGIRRYVDFVALLDNFSTAQQATAVSLGAGGAAARAAGIQLATMKTRIATTKAAFEELGFVIGEELAKPLGQLLKALNSIIAGFLKWDPIIISAVGSLVTFLSTAVVLITTFTALNFIFTFFKTKILKIGIATETAAIGANKAAVAYNGYTVALVGTTAAAEAATGAVVGLTAATTGAASRLNIIVLVLSALAAAYSFLTFSSEEYEAVIQDSTATIASQARAIFQSTQSLIDRETILKKALKDRQKLLKELAVDEGKTDAASLARTAFRETQLAAANAVIAKESKIAEDLIISNAGKGIQAQINLYDQLDKLIDGVNEGFAEEKILLDKTLDILKLQGPIIASNIAEAERSIKDLILLSTRVDSFFGKSKNSAEEFRKSLDGIGITPGFVQQLADINHELETVMSGSVGGLGDFDKRKKILKEGLKGVDNSIVKARASVDVFVKDLSRLKDAIQAEVSPKLFKVIKEDVDNLEKRTVGQINTAIETIEELEESFGKSGTSSKDFSSKIITNFKTISAILGNSSEIASTFVSGAITRTRNDLGQMTKDAKAISFDDAAAGALSLAKETEKARARIHDFLNLNVDKTFVEQFEKIRIGIKNTATSITQSLRLKGVERNAKLVAQNIQSQYISQLKGLDNLTASYEAKIASTNKKINETKKILDDVNLLVTERAKVTGKVATLQAELNNLTEQQKLISAGVRVEKDLLLVRLKKINAEIKKINAEEAGRSAEVERVNFFYDSQKKLAKVLGSTNTELLQIDRARIASLGKLQIEQALLTKDNRTLANVQKISSRTMLELAKNAQDISLSQVIFEMKKVKQLADSIKSALANSFSGITESIAQGVSERIRVTDEIKEAERDLQTASKKGDEEAIATAKLRLKELRVELKEFQSILFEVREFGKSLFEGVGDAINSALSERFANDLLQITLDDKPLGLEIAGAMLGANKDFVVEYNTATQKVLDANKALNDSFITQLTAAFKQAAVELQIALLQGFGGKQSSPATTDRGAQFSANEFKAIQEGIAETRNKSFNSLTSSLVESNRTRDTELSKLNSNVKDGTAGSSNTKDGLESISSQIAGTKENFNQLNKTTIEAGNATKPELEKINTSVREGNAIANQGISQTQDLITKLFQIKGQVTPASLSKAVADSNKPLSLDLSNLNTSVKAGTNAAFTADEFQNISEAIASVRTQEFEALSKSLAASGDSDGPLLDKINTSVQEVAAISVLALTATETTNAKLLSLNDEQIKNMDLANNLLGNEIQESREGNIQAVATGQQAKIDAASTADEVDRTKAAINSGLALVVSTLAAAVGSTLFGGSKAAIGGSQVGAAIGTGVGGPIGTVVGTLVGGFLGGLFGGKEKAKELVPSMLSNTEALNNNTLAIEQLQKNVINAPSNFGAGSIFNTGSQSPAPSLIINVSGSGNPEQVANLVMNRINKDYSRGVRTGTTRKSAL